MIYWDPANANGQQELTLDIKRVTFENGLQEESQSVMNV